MARISPKYAQQLSTSPKRAQTSPVASSLAPTSVRCGPRPSSQSWREASTCKSIPAAGRRSRRWRNLRAALALGREARGTQVSAQRFRVDFDGVLALQQLAQVLVVDIRVASAYKPQHILPQRLISLIPGRAPAV